MKIFKELAGIRTKATVTVTDKAVKVVGDSGELQLTEYGISGIPVFQVSRHIKRLSDKGNDVKVHINFMPGYSTKTVKGMVHNIFSHNRKLDPVTALNGLLNKKLALVLVKNTTIDRGKSCGEITETQTEELVRNIIDFTVTPYDTNGFDNAQVCAGGVNLDEINLNTMESRLVKIFTLQERYWMWTENAEATTCSGHFLRVISQESQQERNKMIRINQIKLDIGTDEKILNSKIQKLLRLKNSSFTYSIVKKSIDARKKNI